MTIKFFHNSHLIRRIDQENITKKFGDLTRNWTQIACFAVRHLNHYIRMFSVLVRAYNWILVHALVILSNSSNWTKIYSFWKNSNVSKSSILWVMFGFDFSCTFLEISVLFIDLHNTLEEKINIFHQTMLNTILTTTIQPKRKKCLTEMPTLCC